MPVTRYTFVMTPLHCAACDTVTKVLLWSYDPEPPCVACHGPQVRVTETFGKSSAVIGDEIDRTISDGVCYADGTPRRFTSRQELRRAEQAAGYRVLERGERFAGQDAARARADARRRS